MLFIIILFLISSFSCKENAQKENTNFVNSVNLKDSIIFNYDSTIAELRKVLPNDFIFGKYSCFVIVSNLNKSETQEIINNTIANAEECFYNDYFNKKPDEQITIFLFKNDETYRHWAKKLYGDTDLSRFGYFKPSKKAMLMNIATGTGTLVHELTHAFVRSDFPDIPSWFNEGLGSLYERCSLNYKEIKGYVNWRLPALQESIADKSYTSIDALLKTDDDEFYGNNSGYNYSQARYLCLYLQENGLLKSYYKKFRDNYGKDNTGKIFLEEIMKDKIVNFEPEFILWVKSLKYQ